MVENSAVRLAHGSQTEKQDQEPRNCLAEKTLLHSPFAITTIYVSLAELWGIAALNTRGPDDKGSGNVMDHRVTSAQVKARNHKQRFLIVVLGPVGLYQGDRKEV